MVKAFSRNEGEIRESRWQQGWRWLWKVTEMECWATLHPPCPLACVERASQGQQRDKQRSKMSGPLGSIFKNHYLFNLPWTDGADQVFIYYYSESHSVTFNSFVTPWTVHGILQTRILEGAAIPFSRDLPMQGSNPGLLHCRWILYQLNHNILLHTIIKTSP